MTEESWSITALADEFGVTLRTIRHYEDVGLITPERRGSSRVFHTRDRIRLQLILRGKRLGFSLVGAPPRSRVYPADEFEADVAAAGLLVESRFATFDQRPAGEFAADVAAAGLEIESRFATFDLRPYDPGGDFAVWVLRRGLEVSDH